MTTTAETPETAPTTYVDTVRVEATAVNDTDVSVTMTASGHEFLRVSIAKEPVEEWIRKGGLAGEMMQVYASANPANEVVRQLLPLLPSLTTLDPSKAEDLAKFKALVRELLGKYQQA